MNKKKYLSKSHIFRNNNYYFEKHYNLQKSINFEIMKKDY